MASAASRCPVALRVAAETFPLSTPLPDLFLLRPAPCGVMDFFLNVVACVHAVES